MIKIFEAMDCISNRPEATTAILRNNFIGNNNEIPHDYQLLHSL